MKRCLLYVALGFTFVSCELLQASQMPTANARWAGRCEGIKALKALPWCYQIDSHGVVGAFTEALIFGFLAGCQPSLSDQNRQTIMLSLQSLIGSKTSQILENKFKSDLTIKDLTIHDALCKLNDDDLKSFISAVHLEGSPTVMFFSALAQLGLTGAVLRLPLSAAALSSVYGAIKKILTKKTTQDEMRQLIEQKIKEIQAEEPGGAQ